MLKEIWNAFKKTNVLTDMVQEVGQMLDLGESMFKESSTALMHERDWESIAEELYSKDKQVNSIEQKVREQIVTHLSLGHTADLSACLILMNVVKDAERIGDYCKNIFEIAKFYK